MHCLFRSNVGDVYSVKMMPFMSYIVHNEHSVYIGAKNLLKINVDEDSFFYTPVFRRDVLWYGDVRPSVRPSQFSALFSYMLWHIDLKFCVSSDGTYYGMVMSVRPSGSPSVRPSQFSALFSYMLWHIDLKFCVSLYFYARKIKFECHQFPSLFAGVMLLFNFKLFQICSFPHFFSYMLWHIEFKFCIWLCFYVPQSKFWVSSFCFNFCMSYASLWTKNTRNTVFRAFLLHALTYWAEILHMTFVLLYYRSSSSVVNLRQFLWELCPFWNLEYWKYTVFRTFLLHPLTYWAESLHITLFFCTTDQVWVSSICVYFGVMPLFELRIL